MPSNEKPTNGGDGAQAAAPNGSELTFRHEDEAAFEENSQGFWGNRVFDASTTAGQNPAESPVLHQFDWSMQSGNSVKDMRPSLWFARNTESEPEDVWKDDDRDLVVLLEQEDTSPDIVSVNLNLSRFNDNDFETLRALRTFPGGTANLLAVGIHWTKGKKKGYSVSPYFAVAENSVSRAGVAAEELPEAIAKNEDFSRLGDEYYLPTDEGKDDEDSDSGTPEGGNESGDEDGDHADGGDNDAIEDSKDENDEGGGNSLSTGAIAGIAVGGVIALIAIGLLVWFFLRRRNRKQARGRSELSQSPNHSNHYIGGKEGHDDHLNSPYSEDGVGVTQHTPLDPNAPRLGATESPASFTPYHDTGAQSTMGRTMTNTSLSTHDHSPVESGHRGLPERSDTAMSSQNVAHLVEDGMTPDDIRRLEEEERELDFEIERAGRRQT